MAQKFTNQDEAAELLGVSKEKLTKLRESGALRAYRDGSSWKFRTDELEKMEAEGVPSGEDEGSDLSLDLGSESDDSLEPAAKSAFELELDEEILMPEASVSDLDLVEPDEPTVHAKADADSEEKAAESDLALELEESSDLESSDLESSDLESTDLESAADSILLSEAELGQSTDRPPSTIIGKAELGLNKDLDLVISEEDAVEKGGANVSDVRLASADSSLLASDDDDLGILEIEPEDKNPAENFADLEELEIDLEAESSRILTPEDVAKAQKAASESSDLGLAATDSSPELASSSIELSEDSDGSVAGLTGISSIELSGESGGSLAGLTGISSFELEDEEDDDDDFVLGEGSDVTLTSESSGINIISPSDSGLALDDVSLGLTGASSVGDLGGAMEEAQEAAEEDFQLTPTGEEAIADAEEGSQIVSLDEMVEEDASVSSLGAAEEEGALLVEDFGAVPGLAGGALTGAAVAAVGPTSEEAFSVPVVVFLGLCIVTLSICGMMIYDMLRNIWSWDEMIPINSSILELINPFL